jgi:hypothetical protein
MKNHIQLALAVATAVLGSLSNIRAQVTVTTNRVGTNPSTTGTFMFPPNTVPSNSSLDLANGKTFTVLAGAANAAGSISNLTNGLAQKNQDSVAESFFAADNNNGIRIQMDLETLHNIERISTYTWHTNSRASQSYRVYGANSPNNSSPNYSAAAFQNDAALTALGYNRIAEVKTATTSGGQYGATVTGTIGQYRYLLFDIATVTSSRGTFYGEIDIYGTPAGPVRFPLTITPAVTPQTGFDLAWVSKPAKSYHLRTSTDLASPINQWETVAQNILHTQPLNRYNVPQSGPRRFYAVEENPALPLLSENFENNNGGFTVSTTAGSAWQYGTPTSSAPSLGGEVTTGAESSAKCWGTNIGNPGFYLPNTVTRLRSSVIDLTNVVGANLTFFQAVDLHPDDTAVVNIIDDTTDTVIAAEIFKVVDSDSSSANWASVQPINLSAGVGQKIRIEWVLTGSSFTDYLGLYIDNVSVIESLQ